MTPEWDTLKQQVKEANDIVDVVGGYLSLRPAGPTYKALCPFHDDQRPSFDVDPRRQRYRCWACNKFGDVISFVQEFEHVSFPEALELLARRAGISLENLRRNPQGPTRASMLDVMRWAAEQFQQCLLDSTLPAAEAARRYLGERRLTGETVRRFGLGFAPAMGDWLVQKAAAARQPVDVLETVGLVARRSEGGSYYDRFRDRVIFPIRDARGQTVGFGGRILPSSPYADRGPKYYNSSETPLFSKSDQLYGIDHARDAAVKAGCLAIVEGYTDVLMAHQCGIANVVATMGTALNARHLKRLKSVFPVGTVREKPKVVLVFDADAGGQTGVDRALELFVSQDVDLRIATLPESLDPCDLLTRDGGTKEFQDALGKATEVLEFKLNRVWADEASQGIEGRHRAVERMLTFLVNAPREQSVKVALIVQRIAHRLNLTEETLWTRLKGLRAARPAPEREAPPPQGPAPAPAEPRGGPAATHEIELLNLVLAEPALVAKAEAEVKPDDVEHPGLRRLLSALYGLRARGQAPDLDHLGEVLDNDRLLDKARQLQDEGLDVPDRAGTLATVFERFRARRGLRHKEAIKSQVQGVHDHDAAVELLRRLSQRDDTRDT